MTADTLYSWALLLAFLAGGSALGAALALRLGWGAAIARRWPLAAGAAAASAVVSFGVHLGWGHAPGTAEPMSFGAFLLEHPAFLVAAAVPVAAVVLARGRGPR